MSRYADAQFSNGSSGGTPGAVPEMNQHVRPATKQDVERMVAIYVESSNLAFAGRMPVKMADDSRIERWRHDLSPGTPTQWWVCERGGVVAGFVGIGPSRDPPDPQLGELDTIAVDPDHWRSGVGGALMRVALDALSARGYARAILWTLSDYPHGEDFYRSWGWEPTGHGRDHEQQVQYAYTFDRHSAQPARV
jgi:N-acetylglutamate synthase-like GNAT family acetyltransferase